MVEGKKDYFSDKKSGTDKKEGRDRQIKVRGITNCISPLYNTNEKRKYADVVIEVFEILMGKKNMFKNEINIDLMKKSSNTGNTIILNRNHVVKNNESNILNTIPS